jgi:hypothetical protein
MTSLADEQINAPTAPTLTIPFGSHWTSINPKSTSGKLLSVYPYEKGAINSLNGFFLDAWFDSLSVTVTLDPGAAYTGILAAAVWAPSGISEPTDWTTLAHTRDAQTFNLLPGQSKTIACQFWDPITKYVSKEPIRGGRAKFFLYHQHSNTHPHVFDGTALVQPDINPGSVLHITISATIRVSSPTAKLLNHGA